MTRSSQDVGRVGLANSANTGKTVPVGATAPTRVGRAGPRDELLRQPVLGREAQVSA